MSSKLSARRLAARTRPAPTPTALSLSAWDIELEFGGTKIIYTLNDEKPHDYPDARPHKIIT